MRLAAAILAAALLAGCISDADIEEMADRHRQQMTEQSTDGAEQ